VRRLLAILIAILVGLPTVTPLFALSMGDDLSRPACCRRDGKHHCMLADMDMSGASSSNRPGFNAPSISERCPYGAKSVPSTSHPDWSLATAQAVFAGVVAHPAVTPQTESKRRISSDRSRQKRGPPAISLS
jgi:hypothetical protein